MSWLRRAAHQVALLLPPKSIADRVFPWVTLAASAFGVVVALWQYSNDVDVRRFAATLDLHREYLGKNDPHIDLFALAAENAGMRARCAILLDDLKNGEDIGVDSAQGVSCDFANASGATEATLAFLKNALAPASRREAVALAVTEAMQTFPISPELKAKIFLQADYLLGVTVCVEAGNCDEKTSKALFLREIIEFVNMTCPLSERLGVGGGLPLRQLAVFVNDISDHEDAYWRDQSRTQNFFACDELNDL